MQKAFENFAWENSPSTATPLGATLLNNLNNAIDEIDDRVVQHEADIADISSDVEEAVERAEAAADSAEEDAARAEAAAEGFEVVDDLSTPSSTKSLSANMGKTLNETKQNKLVEGDHVSIDAQNVISVTDITSIEVESYTSTGTHIADITLDGVKTELYAPVPIMPIVDRLDSTSATSALSANQGRVLDEKITGKQDKLTAGSNITISGNTISADLITSYSEMSDKPSINNITLAGNKSLADLGIASASDLQSLSNTVGSINEMLEEV